MSPSNASESLHALRLLRERMDIPAALPALDVLIDVVETAVVVEFRAIANSEQRS